MSKTPDSIIEEYSRQVRNSAQKEMGAHPQIHEKEPSGTLERPSFTQLGAS